MTDSTSPVIRVQLNGLDIDMRFPTIDQAAALKMAEDTSMPDEDKMTIVFALIMALIDEPKHRTLVLTEMAKGTVTFNDVVDLVTQASERLAEKVKESDTAVSDGKTAAKRTAKRAASARTASGRKRTPAKS